ncbi:GPW/gp25 family protein [Cupriavidus sp. SW-Y-13]|uniref:GPW/gp25 family protein n=1 Tax=Cupriavidus sp. SW-Y-13 TaxID=2653854 RepID=UPI0013658872|nr:GPW/gp25 family protein [Cupriavidus sp. SW-Y-13]MWL87155.1 baseplate assembly protein [Cupriavidus sp. SW-Y-13]
MTYLGLDSTTGRASTDLAHIWQSIRDILTTPIGTRVMRRAYGSDVPELIDQPMNGVTRLRVMSASVAAIVRWEPRVSINAVSFQSDAEGAWSVSIDAERVDGARRATLPPLTIPLQRGRA